MEYTYNIPVNVLTSGDLTSSSKLVFAVLNARKSDANETKLSQDKIAEFLSMSRMTVRDSLVELIALGLVSAAKDERSRFIYTVEI